MIPNNNMAEITYCKMLLFMSFLLSNSGADREVICVFSKSCMLPCQLKPNSDPLIHWIKTSAGDSVVHSYYEYKDQLGHQDQNFKYRTSLFQDQISKGNASLLLKGAKINDEGRYKCYTSTIRGFDESFVNLKIEAPVSKVSISRIENRIICNSEGIYPQPEVSWSTIPPFKTVLWNQTTVQETKKQLYSISSSLIISDNSPDLTYICTVRNRRNRMVAAFGKADTEVFCVFSESCILPCSFQVVDEPVVLWNHLEAEESLVHSYYDSKDQVQHQNQNFRGRTSLFRDQISSGNASLLLTGVKIQDQGRYMCNTSTTGGTKLSVIDVTVDAPVKTVHLQHADNRITCSSEGIYPEPDLTWSTDSPYKVFLRSSTIVQPTEQQLYNIRSSLMVPDDTDLIYSCTVSTHTNSKTARLVVQDKTARGIGIVVGVILVTLLMSLLPCFAERLKKVWKSKQCCQEKTSVIEEVPEMEPINNQGNMKV